MEPTQTSTSVRKYLLFVLFLLVFFVLLFGVAFWYLYPQRSGVLSTAEELNLASENYRNAQNLERSGDYVGAIAEYEKSKNDATSDRELGQIDLRIAKATVNTADYAEAISLLKEIVANPDYTNQAKAYAVEYLGRLFFSLHDPKITTLIFSDEPYKSMVKAEDGGDFEIAYRRLFEYSSSFYPTAASELRVAVWYAHEVYKMYRQGTAEKNKTTIEEYKEIIREKIKNADENLQEPGPRENINSVFPLAINRKAVVVGRLVLTGDTSFGDAESLYQQSLAVADSLNQEGFTIYHYAAFLANLDKKRHGDVVMLLQKIYSGNRFQGTRFIEFLRNEKDNVVPLVHEDIKLLASIDPKFKSFLVTLGWKF